MKNKLSIILTVAVIGIGFLLANLTSCRSCDGKICKKALGFDLNEKPLERDSVFRALHPLNASNFKVFIESSASMDGYVAGHTQFKTTVHRLIGQVVADVLMNDSNLTLNYVNSEILKQSDSKTQFSKGLSPESFKKAGGNRANSDIVDVISKVISSTIDGEVSMFVSDCVYSPESADDIDVALAMLRTDMLNLLKNKSKSNPEFGVLLYRLISDFHGYYYNKTDVPINCNGDRPYFVWFFGDESILANVSRSITQIMNENNAQSVIGIPQYSYLPYKTLKSDHPYHYLSAKTNSDSLYTFNFVADMSYLPLGKDYIMDVKNYTFGRKNYYIKKIEEYIDSKNPNYNFKYTIGIRGGKNSFVTPTLVEISLKSMLTTLPKWVDTYNDPIGNDYNQGYNPAQLRTFGLKSLVDGLSDFYTSPQYVTFKIQIN